MKEIIEILSTTIISEYYASLRGKYCFACSVNHYVNSKEHKPLLDNCKNKRNLNYCKSWNRKDKMRDHLEKWSEDEIIQYLNDLFKGRIPGHGIHKELKTLIVAQLKEKLNYNYNGRIKNPIFKTEQPIKDAIIEFIINDLKPTDIPNLSNKERKNAEFFSSLYNLFYHLEVSIRNYTRRRFKAVIGQSWETELKNSDLIAHAFKRKREAKLDSLYPKRGNDVLNYCNWIDYSKLLDYNESIWDRPTDIVEFKSHISSVYKIRNSIAHNAETIPRENIKEMEVFVSNFVKIFK